ncbi:hypothetical protein IJT10_05770 [bacterium]|nr:hypothetical protein [bacterium]
MTKLEKLLREADLEYTFDDDSELYSIIMEFDDDRTQQVLISNNLEECGDLKILHIYSQAANIDDVPSKFYLKILKDSATKSLGHWEVSGEALIYNIKLPVGNLNSEVLATAINVAAQEADKMEARFSDEDTF